MDRIDADPAVGDQRGEARSLRAGEGKVELAGDAALEEVRVLRQATHRLHHVQVVDPARIDRRERPRKEIGLLLVVAFEADTVARLQQPFKQGRRVLGADPPPRAMSATD